jgi:hypothetical protein
MVWEFGHESFLCVVVSNMEAGNVSNHPFPDSSKKPAADLRRAVSLPAAMAIRVAMTA